MISGKIIASIPTSTSAIVGYLTLQLINLMYSNDFENIIRNGYLNLGLNEFDIFPLDKKEDNEIEEEEEEENKNKYPLIEIKGSKTCNEFLDLMVNNYDYEVFHIEINDKILYDKRVIKDPKRKKKEFEKNQKKLEEIYYEQIKKSNPSKEDKLGQELMIKINCRKKNPENDLNEKIYDFPLIKY